VDQPAYFGEYEVLAVLGRGTTGVICQARHSMLSHCIVVLKMPLLDSSTEAPLRITRFRREAEALANLTYQPDPDFPTLYEVGECRGQPYLTREFVDGRTLEELGTSRALGLREALAILAAVAEAVEKVHGRGLAHRNLHPSNVLVVEAGRPKLIGFGRVGILAGSELLPPGATGVSPEVDVRALREMLSWLGGVLCQPIPPGLEAIQQPDAVASAGAFADVLGRWLQKEEPAE
jgi:serine/threonine protein kinase